MICPRDYTWPRTITPLIAIMKDQVKHLNKIGVAAAMMGEGVDEAVKSGSCEIVCPFKIHLKAYCSHKSWFSKEWTKGLQKESKLQGPLNHPIVNFPFVCWAFSSLELTICIETAFYRNERYLNHVSKP